MVHPCMSKTEFARGAVRGAVQGICRAGLYLQYCFLRAKQIQDTARHTSQPISFKRQPISFKRTLKRTRMSKILAMNKGTRVAGDTRATCHLHTRRFSRIPILNFSLNPIPPVFGVQSCEKRSLSMTQDFHRSGGNRVSTSATWCRFPLSSVPPEFQVELTSKLLITN